MQNAVASRREVTQRCRRLIVKVGTRLLTDIARIPPLVAQLARLRQERNLQILLVSSGAVGIGLKTLGIERRPARLSQVQALAAVGQSKLMALYDQEAVKFGFHTAQLLLTAEDLKDRERHLNVSNCINALWNQDLLPVANENDSVSVAEILLGDNDTLAALLGVMLRADLTVILTTVDGLHDRLPDGTLGARIPIVRGRTEALHKLAAGTDDRTFSIGGMVTKLRAADIVTGAGEALWIADGRAPDTLLRLFAGDDLGTLFVPATGRSDHMQSRKRWLHFFTRPTGRIAIDDGAAAALRRKGRSLLPSGITGTTGEFRRGDAVEICSADGTVVARGLSNYSAAEIALIQGCKSAAIAATLGHDGDDEVVHRDNLVLAPGDSQPTE
jgi:glutamate 5-kinase